MFKHFQADPNGRRNFVSELLRDHEKGRHVNGDNI
jgi:hypothetical protein